MSVKGRTLEQLLAPFREKYFISGEINTKVADMQVVADKIDGLARRYADAEYIRNLARVHGTNVNRAYAEVFQVYRVVV